jgi:hypothetical protein
MKLRTALASIKRSVKRSVFVVLAILSVGLSIPVMAPPAAASAQNLFNPICNIPGVDTSSSTVCHDQNTQKNPFSGTDGVLYKVASLLAFGVGVASVVMVIVGGLKYIFSSGESARIDSARNTIIYALVGLLVSLVAQGLIVFVIKYI